MSIVSSSNSTELGRGVSAPQSPESTGTAEHALSLLPRHRPRPSTSAAPTVSLVIPVRNEARNIGWVLEQITDEVTEIILVDGNSTDVTLVTARRCRPDVRVVPQQGAGKGSALRTGFLAASGDIIVMMDADGSMLPSEISHYVHFLANGYDFVKGSRFISGGSSLDITPFRRLGNLFLLNVFNSLYQGHLTDLCYGFCAFDRRYLEHLDLSATGFEIEAEMTGTGHAGGSAYRRSSQPRVAPPERRIELARDPRRHSRPANGTAPSPRGCFRAPLPGVRAQGDPRWLRRRRRPANESKADQVDCATFIRRADRRKMISRADSPGAALLCRSFRYVHSLFSNPHPGFLHALYHIKDHKLGYCFTRCQKVCILLCRCIFGIYAYGGTRHRGNRRPPLGACFR